MLFNVLAFSRLIGFSDACLMKISLTLSLLVTTFALSVSAVCAGGNAVNAPQAPAEQATSVASETVKSDSHVQTMTSVDEPTEADADPEKPGIKTSYNILGIQNRVGPDLPQYKFSVRRSILHPVRSVVETGAKTQLEMRGLREDMNGLSNSVRMLNRPIYQLNNPIEKLKNPLTDLDQSVGNLHDPINRLHQPLSGLQEPIGNLKNPLTNLRTPLNSVGNSVSELSKPIYRLSTPLHELRKSTDGIAQPLRGVNSELKGLQKPIGDIAEPLNQLSAPIAALQPSLNNLSPSVNALNERIGKLEVQIGLLQQSLDRLSRDIPLAIFLSAALIGAAIWTARRVPSVQSKPRAGQFSDE
jgi:predicted  nucleic acid-binding Zn-ribbon protein